MQTKMTPAFAGLALVLLAAANAVAADKDDEKTFYFIGMAISQNLEMLDLSDAEAAQVVKGLSDSLAGKAEQLDPNVYNPKVRTLTNERMDARASQEKSAGDAYVAKMAGEAGAKQTATGLVYLETKAGTGEQPTAASRVKAHYHGILRDGTVFDSSVNRGQPLEIGLSQVIPCWTEGIAMMKEGGKARLTCPSNIAYGERGSPPAIPPNAALTFDVELIEILP